MSFLFQSSARPPSPPTLFVPLYQNFLVESDRKYQNLSGIEEQIDEALNTYDNNTRELDVEFISDPYDKTLYQLPAKSVIIQILQKDGKIMLENHGKLSASLAEEKLNPSTIEQLYYFAVMGLFDDVFGHNKEDVDESNKGILTRYQRIFVGKESYIKKFLPEVLKASTVVLNQVSQDREAQHVQERSSSQMQCCTLL